MDYPLDWNQVKALSQRLTKDLDNPVLVVPKVSPSMKSPLIKEYEYTGYYCEFEATVVVNHVEGDKHSIFELAGVYNFVDPKTKIHTHYKLKYPDMELRGGSYLPEQSFKLSKHSYWMQSDNIQFTGFSDKPLELGEAYRIRGLLFTAKNNRTQKAVSFQESYMLIDEAQSMREICTIDKSFFEKFKGVSIDEMRDSVAYPFENSVAEYKSLIFFAAFYLKTVGMMPLNILLLGRPGSTKSAFLERMASISGDTLFDSGSCTLKGLMPAFSARNMSAGVLATSRHFAIINEFFEIIKTAKKQEGAFDALSTMKQMLEGKTTRASSGNGSMTVKMRGSVFMASNWSQIGTESRQTKVSEYYSTLDPAFLDRLLIYPVPQEEQMALANQHSAAVSEKLSRYCNKEGEVDMIPALSKMPTDKKLTTVDLRTLLVFKRQLTPIMEPDGVQLLTMYKNDIAKRYGYDIYTRSDHFIKNIATAYALARSLSEGLLGPESRTVKVLKEDLSQAASYYRLVLARHHGFMQSGAVKRHEFLSAGVSQGQKYLLAYLKGKHLMGILPAERKVPVQELYREFKVKFPEMDFNFAIRGLIENRVVVWDGECVLYIDDWVQDEVIQALYNNSANFITVYAEQLRMAGLLQEDSNKNLRCDWITRLPDMPLQSHIDEVLGALKAGRKPVLDGLEQREVQNLILYLCLSGEIYMENESLKLSPHGTVPLQTGAAPTTETEPKTN